MGPILFILYTVDVISLIESHGFGLVHLYADDTQVYYRNLVGTGFTAPNRSDIMRSSIPLLRAFVGNWRGFFKDLRLSDTTTLLGILID